jgi:hypothetical protein
MAHLGAHDWCGQAGQVQVSGGQHIKCNTCGRAQRRYTLYPPPSKHLTKHAATSIDVWLRFHEVPRRQEHYDLWFQDGTVGNMGRCVPIPGAGAVGVGAGTVSALLTCIVPVQNPMHRQV